MKLVINKLLTIFMALFVIIPFIYVKKVYAEELVNEIRITSDVTRVEEVILPPFTVTTTTEGISLEQYGSNTRWHKWETNNTSWYGFGDGPEVAENNGTHYALRILVRLDDGYEFGNEMHFYLNDVDVTNEGHTTLYTGFDWGGYLCIDLGEVYVPVMHTVYFNSNGGSPVDYQVLFDGTCVGIPDNPILESKVFAGWYADETLNTPYNFVTEVHSDMTLFAKWVDAVTVTIDVNGGDPLDPNQFVVGKGTPAAYLVEMVPEATHSNQYKYLAGLKINSLESEMLTEEQISQITVENDMTIFLVWDDVEIIDSLELGIHTGVAGQVVETYFDDHEEQIVPNNTPTFTWEEDRHYGNFNPAYVVGPCSANQCETLFEGEFVEGQTYYAMLNLSTEYEYGFNNTTIANITFHNGEVIESNLIDSHNLMLTVAFVATPDEGPHGNNVTLTFDTNGGEELAPIVGNVGDHIQLPYPVREGYYLYRWIIYIDGEAVGDITDYDDFELDVDVTLQADWIDINNQIHEINIEIDPLYAGTVVEIGEFNDPIWGEYEDQTNQPNPINLDGVHYSITNKKWVNGTCGVNHSGHSCDDFFLGTIVEGEYYYALFNIEADNNYYMTQDLVNHITVNGQVPEEIYDIQDSRYTYIVARIRAVNENNVVTFKDGDNELFQRNIHYGDSVIQPENPNKPDNNGIRYEFAGWFADETLNIPFDFNSEIVANTNIYAKFTESRLKTVNFYDGNNLIATDYVESHARPLQENPVKNGFTFENWYSDRETNNVFDFNQNIDGESINIYAKFIENKHDVDFNITSTETVVNIVMNDVRVLEEDEDQSDIINKTVENVGYNVSANTIRIVPRFGDLLLESVTINGTRYTGENENVNINNDEWTIIVPASDAYAIVIDADENAPVPRTIIWANVDANNQAENYDEDMVLEHGIAKILGVYDQNNNRVSGENKADNDGMGYAVVEPGNNVLFEFAPEYGYQLTSVLVNGVAVEAQAGINQYLFEMPNANVHFQAVFKRTEDIVYSNSSKVESGSIALGNNLDGGSAKLTISDVELSKDKLKDFEKYAENYTLKTFLDIDLYNIFYKGKDDASDVWSNKINELDKEATITIKLSDDVDVSNVVLVHNIHDGDEYEVIEIISYDLANHTITFKTKSFSNYAIALRNAVDTSATTNPPKTLDNINNNILLLTISTLSLGLSGYLLRKKYNNE